MNKCSAKETFSHYASLSCIHLFPNDKFERNESICKLPFIGFGMGITVTIEIFTHLGLIHSKNCLLFFSLGMIFFVQKTNFYLSHKPNYITCNDLLFDELTIFLFDKIQEMHSTLTSHNFVQTINCFFNTNLKCLVLQNEI